MLIEPSLQAGIGNLLQGVDWAGILSNVGIFGIAAAAFTYLARKFISDYFERKQQSFQAELDKEKREFQSEIDKEIREFQNELNKEMQEFRSEIQREQLKFSDLHQKRADVVREFYAKMSDFHRDMRDMVDPFIQKGESPRDEKIRSTAESAKEFHRYYRKNKIYFPEHISNDMEELLSEYRDMFHEFSIKRIHDEEESPYDTEERLDEWLENWEKLTEEGIPELREQLEDHFRDLLGVVTEDSDSNDQDSDGDS